MNIETAEQAREYIESKGIEIIPGKAYNLYTPCGCVVQNDDDPNNLAYFEHKQYKQRCCPHHETSTLLNKYKQCKCGQEFFSSRVQASEKCAACYGIKPGKKKPPMGLRNGHLYDKKGADCLFRDDCLKKYDKFDCTPCLGCQKFIKKDFDAADYLSARGRTEDQFYRVRR